MNKTIIAALSAVLMSAGNISAKSAPKAGENDLSAYLLAYFSDSDHSLHFAISDDGYSFEAINDNKPIISGDTISEQHGIRDPHIYRGPDNRFYLVMTDLHIFGKQAGLRDSQWERPDEYGWGNNRAIVMMHSDDLIHWSHSVVRLDKLFPAEFKEIGCAWAPQTIYDPEAGKMMVYLTIRKQGEKLGGGNPEDKKTRLFYAYANDDFTSLVTKPVKLLAHDNDKVQVLDADICPMPDGRYLTTYVAQEHPAGGIRMAVSDNINNGHEIYAEQIDGEKGACEAPNVWKRIGEDKWVLMYDIFSINPHNFGFVETTDFKTFTPLGRFNEGPMKSVNFTSPKHGSVVHLTKAEAKRLRKHYPNKDKKKK